MKVAEMKKKINEGLDNLPDRVVEQVYILIREAESVLSSKLVKDEDSLNELFDKYDDIFKRLAK